MTPTPIMSAADVATALAEIDAGLADLERAKRRIAKGQAMLTTATSPKSPRKAPGRVVKVDPKYTFTEAELEADRARLARGTRVA